MFSKSGDGDIRDQITCCHNCVAIPANLVDNFFVPSPASL